MMRKMPTWLRPRPALIIPSVALVVGLILLIVTPTLLGSNKVKAVIANAPDVLRRTNLVDPGSYSQLLVQPLNVTHVATIDAPACTTPSIDLKLLVLSADGQEVDLPAIRQALDYLGTPYTLYIATQHLGQLAPSTLATDCHALYQGVILTTGSLAYNDNGTWKSALTATEWTNLWTFEAKFSVRQASWYTYPNADFGYQPLVGTVNTTAQTLQAHYTAAAKTVFPYVNTANTLPIRYAYTFLAHPLDANTQPLLTDDQGNALVAIKTYPDRRQNLAMTFDSNPYLVHDQVLSYGVINWLTRGIFVGDRHVTMEAQIDDVFLDDFTWQPTAACGTNLDLTGTTYRINGADLQAVVNWQTATEKNAVTRAFRLDMAFNGIGSTSGYYQPDSLTPYVKKVQNRFFWTNHTYDHANLDTMSYADALKEVQSNISIGKNLRFTQFSTLAMVTPDISGLTNPNFLKAAYDSGIRYLVTDTSRPGYNNPYPNGGLYNPLQPQIMMVPRHPVNLFFNVSTPAEWTAEYNCIYRSYWGRDLSYDELLDKESDTLLSYLLKGDSDPAMYHQPNLRAYDGTHTLLGDLLDKTFAKYSALENLPIASLRLDAIGGTMVERQVWHDATYTVTKTGKTLTITADRAIRLPITGVNQHGATTYGGQFISYLNVPNTLTVTLP